MDLNLRLPTSCRFLIVSRLDRGCFALIRHQQSVSSAPWPWQICFASPGAAGACFGNVSLTPSASHCQQRGNNGSETAAHCYKHVNASALSKPTKTCVATKSRMTAMLIEHKTMQKRRARKVHESGSWPRGSVAIGNCRLFLLGIISGLFIQMQSSNRAGHM